MYLNVWFGRRDNIMIACGWMILGGILSACAINIGMVTKNPLRSNCLRKNILTKKLHFYSIPSVVHLLVSLQA